MTSTPKNTTTKVEPWDGAQSYLLEQYAKADGLFKDGAPKPYQGSTIADQSKATKDALNGVENLARNGDTSALTNSTNAVNSVLTQGGQNQATNTLSELMNGTALGTNPATAIAGQIANGQPSAGQNFTNPALSQAQGYGNYTNAAMGLQSQQANSLAGQNNPAMAYLQNTASGANIGNNPYLDRMVSGQQDQIANKLKTVTNPGIDSQAAALGRMGSGAFASQRNNAEGIAANEMAKVATDMYGNQYNQDVQNQMNAAGQYGNFANQDVTNRLNANQALSNSDNQQQQTRLAGTGLLGDLANSQQTQRQNATNSDRDYQLQGLNTLNNSHQQNIANMLAGNDQRMNAANSQLNATSDLNNQKLNAANMAGQTYQNQYMPYQQLAGVGQERDARSDLELQSKVNAWDRSQQQPIQNISNMINMLNGGGYNNTTTPVYSNTGGQILGGLSALAGLFALCSAKVKTIHSLLGYMPLTNGGEIAIYEFSYTNDPDGKIWVGPIAEEVEEDLPEAVVEFDEIKHIDVERFMLEVA